MISQKIAKLKKIRGYLLQEFMVFPLEKWDTLLFGKWNLKDVIAHLNNWMVHDIDCLNALKESRVPHYEPSVDAFNQRGVDQRKSYSWLELISEFQELSDQLLGIYQDLPNNFLTLKIWPNLKETPERFIQEEIDHWSLELNNIKSRSRL